MNAEQNKAVVRCYTEAFSRGEFQAVAELCTENVTIQGVLGKGGLDTVLPVWRELHEAFGIRLQIEEMVAEQDQVAVLYTESGTFVKPFRGRQPTGKSYAVVAMEWFKMRDGKIAARWGARDSAAIFRQLEPE